MRWLGSRVDPTNVFADDVDGKSVRVCWGGERKEHSMHSFRECYIISDLALR